MVRFVWAGVAAALCASMCAAMPMDSVNVTEVVVPTTVALDGSKFTLQIDTMEAAIWLRCTAVGEDATCESKKVSEVPGAKETTSNFLTQGSVVYTTRKYSKLTVNGQTFADVPVNIVYSSLYYVRDGNHGIIGLNFVSGGLLYDHKATATLTLGSAGTPLTVDESTKALYARIKQDTAVDLGDSDSWTAATTCIRPLEGTLGECLPLLQQQGTADSTTSIHLNPATQTIVVPAVALDAFAKLYLAKCKAESVKSAVTGYSCPADTKLPSLAFEISGWRFVLKASEYSEVWETGDLWVKLGSADANLQRTGNILGLPFLRKFAVYSDKTNKVNALFCSTTAGTCEKVSPSAKSIISYFQEDHASNSNTNSSTPAPTATSDSSFHHSTTLAMVGVLSLLSLLV